MIYLALLDTVAPQIVGLESFADGEAAQLRHEMYVTEAMARGKSAAGVWTPYRGTSAPSMSAQAAFVPSPDYRRIKYYNASSVLIVNELCTSAAEFYARRTGLEQYFASQGGRFEFATS